MAIAKKWSRVEQAELAPDAAGIYEFGLARARGSVEVVYIGRGDGAGGIRARVLAHVRGARAGNPGLSELIAASSDRVRVRWRTASWLDSAANLEVDALEDFERRHGLLPRFNARQERTRDGILGLLQAIGFSVS